MSTYWVFQEKARFDDSVKLLFFLYRMRDTNGPAKKLIHNMMLHLIGYKVLDRFDYMCELCKLEQKLEQKKASDLVNDKLNKIVQLGRVVQSGKVEQMQTQIAMPDENKKCEVCGSTDSVSTYKTIKFCAKCLIKEKEAEVELKKGEKERVEAVAKAVNGSVVENISVKSDYFNAEVGSIVAKAKELENDSNVTNKQFELAKWMKERFEDLQKKLIQVREVENQIISSQTALQSHLQQMTNKLREDERNLLKLKDINYKPAVVKDPTTKTSKPRVQGPKKFDKEELNQIAKQYNLNPSLLQMTCVARNVSPKDAAQILLASMGSTNQDKIN